MTTGNGPKQGSLRSRLFEWWLHPVFFRVWTVYGGCLFAGWSLWSMYTIGWWVQPAYMMLLIILLATTSRDRCSRCRHFKTWHCGGVGIVAARFTDQRFDSMSMEELRFNRGVLGGAALATVLALFNTSWIVGLIGVIWLVVAVVTTIPSDGDFSWSHPTTPSEEGPAPLEVRQTPVEVDPQKRPGARTDPIAYWMDERDFVNGIPLFPLDEESSAPPSNPKTTKGSPPKDS